MNFRLNGSLGAAIVRKFRNFGRMFAFLEKWPPVPVKIGGLFFLSESTRIIGRLRLHLVGEILVCGN